MSNIDIDSIIKQIKEQAVLHKSIDVEEYKRNLKFLMDKEEINVVSQPSNVFKIGKKIDQKLNDNAIYQKIRPGLVKYKEIVKNDHITINVGELLKYDDIQFITLLYKRLLNREPDEAGLANNTNMLRLNKLSKVEIINNFLTSEEYVKTNRNIKVKKLRSAYLLQKIQNKSMRIPFIGYIFNIIIEIIMLPKRNRQLEEFRKINAILINENKHDIIDVMEMLKNNQNILNTSLGTINNEVNKVQEQLEQLDGYYNKKINNLNEQLKQLDGDYNKEIDNLNEQLKQLDGDYNKEIDNLHTQLEKSIMCCMDNKKYLNELRKENELKLERLQEKMLQVMVRVNKISLNASYTEIEEENSQDEIDIDQFYVNFENKFRGAEELISKRLDIYIDRVKKNFSSKDDVRLLDLGCGRGEWIDKLLENGFDNVIGIDLNSKMISECKEKGLNVVYGNAIDYLKMQPDNTINFISGFQIIEHLSFEEKMQFVQQSYRVLKNGGVLLMETPNPENVLVGSCNFYTDLTHQNPVHPETLKFVMEEIGFKQTEIIRVNPLNYIDQSLVGGEMRHIAFRFNMEQDYSVWGVK